MDFGIYVHTQGPSPLREVARTFDGSLNRALAALTFEEIDGLFISIQSIASLSTGSTKYKKRVRRNHNLRLITGGTVPYKCMVEYDALVSDGDCIEASTSEPTLFEFVRRLVLASLPKAMAGLSGNDLTKLQLAASDVTLGREATW